MDKSTGNPFKDKHGDPITADASFIPESADGTVDVVFEFDASGMTDKTLVAFEELSNSIDLISTHEDINDEAQTVRIPEIRTTLVSEADTHLAPETQIITLTDTVEYRNLKAGNTYTVEGRLLDKATGFEVLDDEGNIIKTYSNISELADEKLKVLLDNLLNNAIEKSEELYGSDYKNDLQKQVNGLKQNITKTKEALSGLFFYTEGGFDTVTSLENALTLVDNASLIAMPHMDEIYLALSRTSNRYDDEYECIKGDNQSYNPLQDEKLSITFSFDHYLFNERGIVYIDGIEVSKENYEISKGSTVITLNNAYLKTLSVGNHTMTLKLDDKEASANFTITNDSSDNSNSKNNETNESNKKINNPSTKDNIMFYVSILGLSIVGISIIGLYLKKKNKLKGRGN